MVPAHSLIPPPTWLGPLPGCYLPQDSLACSNCLSRSVEHNKLCFFLSLWPPLTDLIKEYKTRPLLESTTEGGVERTR